MRTARYRAVPPKSTVGNRLREKSIVDNRLREKKGRRGKEEKKKRRKNTSRRPRPRTVLARGSPAQRHCPRPRAIAALAHDFSPAQGERSRRLTVLTIQIEFSFNQTRTILSSFEQKPNNLKVEKISEK
ncbi:hypothetical protein GW17_00023715 [Ensete ventricosum]|nr:hypothetical protein GW17_00023715 [Ensete ventricosum]RZR80736.1 hypothetical protein BHM03_00006811 [Ensete ventricosum]